MRWLTLILLSAVCSAQVQGNAPYVYDASTDGTLANNSNGQITWPENIAINDTLVACVGADSGSTYSIADTLGNTWTTTTPTQTPSPQTGAVAFMAYTKSSSAGADTITVTGSGSPSFIHLSMARVKNLGVVDGSVATSTAPSPVGNIGTISTTQTTTVNGDLIFSCAESAPFGGSNFQPGNTENISGVGGVNTASTLTLLRTGTLGSYTATENLFGGSSTYAMQSLAFKPSAIMITDTVMPDAGVGVAYSAQLHGIGGTAAQSYSCPSLPSNGLSLNTSTGVISSATPTVGTVSFSCTTTDGTNTSSAASLSIKISALGTPSIRQTAQLDADHAGDAGGAAIILSGVRCGDVIIAVMRGDDTHGGTPWIQAASGVNNSISDSFGSPVRRMLTPITGNHGWPVVVYAIGPVTQSGSDTITIKNNQQASSGRPVSMVFDISGANLLDDVGAFGTAYTNTTTGSFSATYTTVVPNTLLLSLSDSDTNSSTAFSVSAPFNIITTTTDAQGLTAWGTALISSASSVTATTSFTGGSASNQQFDALLVPVRPSILASSCALYVGAGERFKKQIF